MAILRFDDVVANANALMGVKAVWGRSTDPVMCFGSRGNSATKSGGHFALAKSTAARALEQPYLITLGGGDEVPPELNGHVLELVRVTGVFGETNAFVRDPAARARLARWPVAVVVTEVYAVAGEPRLVEDLGFADRRILQNAYDSVRRDDELVEKLWAALREHEIKRRHDIRWLPGFRDPRRVVMRGTMYPQIVGSSAEGRRVREESTKLERDPALARAVKEQNRESNGGVITCEACDLTEADASLFDAHHLEPLAAGIRQSRTDDFAVLCPTCHRWAHRKATDVLQPLSVSEVRAAWGVATHYHPTKATE